MATVTEELNFEFYLILINLSVNLSRCTWLPATQLDSTVSPGVRENRLKTTNQQRNKHQWEKPCLDENDYLALTWQTFEGSHGVRQRVGECVCPNTGSATYRLCESG